MILPKIMLARLSDIDSFVDVAGLETMAAASTRTKVCEASVIDW